MSKLGKWGMLAGAGTSLNQFGSQIREEWLRQVKREETLADRKADQDFTLNRDEKLASQRAEEQAAQNEFTASQNAENREFTEQQNALSRDIQQAQLELQQSNAALDAERIRTIIQQTEQAIDISSLELEELETLRTLRQQAMEEQDPQAQQRLLDTYQRLQGNNPPSRYQPVEIDQFDDLGTKTGESVYTFDRQAGSFSPMGANLNSPPGGDSLAAARQQVQAAVSAGVPVEQIISRLRQAGYGDAQIQQLGIINQ
jgi:hypothetical protein